MTSSAGTATLVRMPRKVALLYAPPWKIGGEFGREGPPPEYRPGDLDADFHQTPYGLFALGAGALRAGHQVKVINLSSYPWAEVERVIAALDADVFGLSCWTANRRGVAYVAELVKRVHPNARVVIGGPHATPLAPELLAHVPAFDLVCLGESDDTFLDLLARHERGESWVGTPGTVARDGARIVRGPERPQIKSLDSLATPQAYFPTHILMTSRGCPWACTFCGAETSWGRGFRANSIDYVLDAMEAVLPTLSVKMIQIKDDTFTTNKKRVLDFCKALRARNLGVLWSCDTRVDLLTDELCKEMRLAGCSRLSLGVESGSQQVLDAIDKKITPDEIARSTELAKKYGIKVRYYMMLGNRGETRETFEETLRFLERARPHEYVFSCLSIYPGTRDFEDAEKTWLDRNMYFTDTFQEYKVPFDATEETTQYLDAWFRDHHGLRTMQVDGVAEFAAILERLPDFPGAHLDLGAAHYREGNLDLAETHVRKALDLRHPLPGLCHNHLACIAYARGNVDEMMDQFSEAARVDPQHWVLIQNVQRARAWFKTGAASRGEPLHLEARHDFQLLERTVQPALPGPLADDFAVWNAPLQAPEHENQPYLRTPEVEGSKKGLRLRVL